MMIIGQIDTFFWGNKTIIQKADINFGPYKKRALELRIYLYFPAQVSNIIIPQFNKEQKINFDLFSSEFVHLVQFCMNIIQRICIISLGQYDHNASHIAYPL